jgi:hypothetical protein
MTVLITLTTAGTDTGPFNLFSDLDLVTPFEVNIPKSALVAGYSSTIVPPGTTVIRVQSVSPLCKNYIDIILTTLDCTCTLYTGMATFSPLPLPNGYLGASFGFTTCDEAGDYITQDIPEGFPISICCRTNSLVLLNGGWDANMDPDPCGNWCPTTTTTTTTLADCTCTLYTGQVGPYDPGDPPTEFGALLQYIVCNGSGSVIQERFPPDAIVSRCCRTGTFSIIEGNFTPPTQESCGTWC